MLVTTESEKRKKSGFSDLEAISAPLKLHLEVLNRFMENQVDNFESEIQNLISHCLKNGGKKIRPILVFYSGWTSNELVLEDLVKVSTVIEFVHIASLIHDDILDEATLRHNDSTVGEKFGPEVAVLLGDALFSQALRLAAEFPSVEVCRAISESTRRVCSGEIEQTFQRGNPKAGVEDYYRIINSKTAELFYVSCFLGAKLSGYDPDFIEAAGKFGRHIGIAYQIFDDLADFIGQEESIGKTLGTDIGSGKFTLPLILLLKAIDPSSGRKLVMNIRGAQPVNLETINRLLLEKGILNEIQIRFNREVDAAERVLAPFSDYPPIGHLMEISAFIRSLHEKTIGFSPRPLTG